jgi:hypothetical protein
MKANDDQKTSVLCGGCIHDCVGADVSAGGRNFSGRLLGVYAVPAVSTIATGRFTATIIVGETAIRRRLSYADLEGAPTAVHLVFAQRGTNGGILATLCINAVPTPLPGMQPCPFFAGTVEGFLTANEVVGPISQGI